MRKGFKTILCIIILALTLSLLGGCSSGIYKKEIIETWTVNETEFNENNDDVFSGLQTMLYSMVFQPGSEIEFVNKDKVSIMGNSSSYKWIEDGKLQIGDDGDDAILFDVEIKKDAMTLENQIVKIYLSK